jgi:hypothetical protein
VGGFGMKAPFNNNLPILVNDVIINPINPENPDSNQWLQVPKCNPVKKRVNEVIL